MKIKLLIKTTGADKVSDFSLKLANYIKEKGSFEIEFLTITNEDWLYFHKRGCKNIEDVRDYLHQIPTRKIHLNLYDKWNLDKDKILLDVYIRYKNMGSKSLDHYATQEQYFLIPEIVNNLYRNRRIIRKVSSIKKIFYYLLKLFNLPLIPLTKKKSRYHTYEIKLYIHKLLYYWSKIILTGLRYLPKTVQLIIWKKKFQSLNIIAFMNKNRGFSNIAKLALKYFVSYYYILKKTNPDAVLIYNGNWAANTSLSAACEKLDICHFFTETSSFIGYSHFDPVAVWCDGSINEMELPEWSEKKEMELEEKIFGYLKNWGRGIASAAEDDKMIEAKIPENKFIFLPLQMMNDTNNIKFSPLLDNILQLVRMVVKYTPKEYTIIVKRHPWDRIFADPLYWKCYKVIEKIAKKHENVQIYHYADSHVLLKHCEVLITANSTLALENLLEARSPMVILGENFVRGWGFTYDVNYLEEFPDKLREALKKKVTPEMELKMKQFLYLYFFNVIVIGNYEIKYDVHDKRGKVIKRIHIPPEYKYIANRLLDGLLQIQEKKEKNLKRRSPCIKEFRCMIDRKEIPNYKGVILDYIAK